MARKWQHRGGRFPHNAHADPTASRKESGLHPRCSPNFCDSPAVRQGPRSSVSNLPHARAELHRCVCHILAACTDGNGSDYGCSNDSAFHESSPSSPDESRVRADSFNALPFSNRQVGAWLAGLLSYRHIRASAELQGPVLFTAASAEGDSGDYRRKYDHALHVHGLLS